MAIPFHSLRISGTCPSCHTNFFFASEVKDANDATTDCAVCDVTLIVKDNKVYLLHDWIHSQDQRWPKDGKDTESIKL
jgi:hypothetical protein